MRKILIGTLLLLGCIAAGYLLFTHRATPVLLPSSASSTPPVVSNASMYDESQKYVVNLSYPHFGVPAIDSKLDRMLASTTAEFKRDAQADDSGQSAQYELSSTYDSVYTSPSIVSARLIVSEYTGGAHPNSSVSGLNYDPRTGIAYTLESALKMTGLTLPQLAAQSLEKLQAAASDTTGEIQFPEGAAANAQNYSAFVIGEKDVTFYFQPYQVAAYAAGILKVSFVRIQ